MKDRSEFGRMYGIIFTNDDYVGMKKLDEILRENFVIYHLEPLGNNIDSCIKLIETLNNKRYTNINIRSRTLNKYKNTRLKENNKQWGN